MPNPDPAPDSTPPSRGEGQPLHRRLRNLPPPILFVFFLLLGLRFFLVAPSLSVDPVTITTAVTSPLDTSSPEHPNSAAMASEQT